MRNMNSDEDLSQDLRKPARETNPKSRQRWVIGSGSDRVGMKAEGRRWKDEGGRITFVLPEIKRPQCPVPGRMSLRVCDGFCRLDSTRSTDCEEHGL